MVGKARFDGIRAAVAFIPMLVADAIDAILRRRSVRTERRARAQAVHQLTRELARAADPSDVARVLSEAAIDSMDATGAWVEQVNGTGEGTRVVGAAGVGAPAVGARVRPSTDGNGSGDGEHRRAARVASSLDTRTAPDDWRGSRIAALPLRANGQTIGALTLLRAEAAPPFDEADLTWARMLADIGGFALDRCIAFRKELDFRTQVLEIIEGIGDPFMTVDGDGRVTYLNATAQQISRRCFARGDSLIGHQFWAALPELRHDGIQAAFRRILERRQPAHVEWFAPALGGWLEVHAYPWKHGVAAYARDVSDRKAADAQLVESEARLRTLANHLPDAAIFQAVGDPAGELRCTYVSDGIARLNPAAAPAILEHPAVLLDELETSSREALAAAVAEALRTLNPFRIELAALGTEENRRWYELAAEPRRADGQLIWDGLLLDVTRRKRAEQELARLTDGRARLLRGFSHDMKNPLGAADGLAQLLELGNGGNLTAQQLDIVARIRGSIRIALELIDDVLDLARAESGGLDLERSAVDVRAVVLDLIEQYRAQALGRGLTLEAGPGAPHPRAMCDRTRVYQIVGNLISNAIKYTQQGRVSLQTGVRSDRPGVPGQWVTITVRDTGPGIPADKRESIFEEFTRLDEASTEGAGVGLSISRRVARLMGGDITVADADGSGSVFTLWLPADARRRPATQPSPSPATPNRE